MTDCGDLIRELYAVVAKLESRYPGRPFTPDGHLVGSIGEVLAESRYALRLLPCSTPKHDARAADGRLVQAKATQGKRVSFYGQPDHLIVLRLTRDGTAQEVFNGPGTLVWSHMSKVAKNGQCTISITTLQRLMASVPLNERIPPAASPQHKITAQR